MKPVDYPEVFKDLIRQLKRLPGVGPRSSERMALWLIQSRNSRPSEIAQAILDTAERVHPCPQCGFFTVDALCAICADESRPRDTLCVVEQPIDILPLERTGVFRGRYHSLGGRIAPLDHIGPDDLRIDALIERVKTETPAEVILALGADVEGEATANYIAELLRPLPATITRIAQGLPAGGGLEHADELTLRRAMSGRLRI